MKKLLMGNEAIALGALRAGVSIVTGYPGTPSTEILETIAREAKVSGSRASRAYIEWSVNEKAALELAAGAACSGARVLVTMKQVGLNVASDPLMSLNYLGVSGGMVVAVADDPGPISSQTEQDTRRFGLYAKIPVFDPSTPEEAYLMIADAYNWSERYGRPVILRPTTRVCHSYASVEILPDLPQKPPAGFDKAEGRWVIFPNLSYRSHIKIEEGLVKMGEGFSAYFGNQLIGDKAPAEEGDDPVQAPTLGIATGGVSYAYAMEFLDPLPPQAKLLKVGTFPFPASLALKFLNGLDEVLVVEELDPVIEDELVRLCGINQLKITIRGKRSGDMPNAGENALASVGEKIESFLKRKIWVNISDLDKEELPETTLSASGLSPAFASLSEVPPAALAAAAAAAAVASGPPPPEAPPLPVRPPVLCAGCPHRGSFFAVKEAVRKYAKGRKAVFSGDIGCYTLGNAQPLDMVDTCLCMGAGITMAQGINRAEALKGNSDSLNFAFIGDSTFFHTGIPGIVNAVYNKADIIIVVLDNFTTAMTGNQPHPGMGRNVLGADAEKISIPAVISALGVKAIEKVNPFDIKTADLAVKSLIEKSGVRAIVFEGPCIAVSKSVSPCIVDTAKCTGCQSCIKKLGCPAISIQPVSAGAKLKALIDPVLCTGCGICKEICAFGAIGGAAL
ncbi:thiamine pyrophosphate-dependent enzyme [Leadbettera azotonutricia]|uniref:Indolepyruvate oxidoreductase subunit IorA (IOR)(Indolepyruvate ferredoxin oxidoreductase subunit alpha) n=1 Tax=Leadbettera azotonutricia (strain ATCC BAA-888 / DSM 13862 / ZAS-9) TaxID=545695 RepID=F5YFX8_LEAAZ|nr:thiamine pyrophosphate-dependent enzyme [Leadbettera azotonutricia]AEF82382.1 indolepyruvate oxidoreductase subunit IorA (IOR)(Indolepyruvate ferredoxin oxidoreductase subunit alpha) [Leadbettera azotonutricia ZAS-9]